MFNLTLNDSTQMQLESRVLITEELLSKVLSYLNNGKKQVKIYAMPDLGISAITERMLGGIFNGMCITWETDIPFIPIDAQIKSCGAAIFELKENISADEFMSLINKAYQIETEYIWDYNFSNHFIILAEDYQYHKQYFILHGSAKEYQMDSHKALILTESSWYEKYIRKFEDSHSEYYIRYICGEAAEKFFEIADTQNEFLMNKNRDFAKLVLGDKLNKELTNLSHYGMPNKNTICIGCHWTDSPFPLLTSPGKDLFLLKPNEKSIQLQNDGKRLVLSPHGLGLAFKDENIRVVFHSDYIEFNGERYFSGHIMDIDNEVVIRGNNDDILNHVGRILEKTPADISLRLKQICSFSKRGLQIF